MIIIKYTGIFAPSANILFVSSLVYEAELKTDDDTFNYKGFTEGTIKDRITKHKTSFEHLKYRNNTELSKKLGIIRKTRTSEENTTFSEENKQFQFYYQDINK